MRNTVIEDKIWAYQFANMINKDIIKVESESESLHITFNLNPNCEIILSREKIRTFCI